MSTYVALATVSGARKRSWWIATTVTSFFICAGLATVGMRLGAIEVFWSEMTNLQWQKFRNFSFTPDEVYMPRTGPQG